MSKESAMALAKGQPMPAKTLPPSTTAQQPRPAAGKSPGQLAEEAAAEAHTAPEGTPAAPKEPTQDERMAGLLKKETGLVRDRETLTKEREKFETEKRELLERTGRADKQLERGKQFDDLIEKNDPIAALRLIGLDDNKIVELMARAGQPVEKKPEEIAEEIVDKKLNERDQKAAEQKAEADKKANAEVITQFRGQINESVKASAETHPLVHYAGEAADEQIFLAIEERVKAPEYKSVPLKQLIEDAKNDLEELYLHDYEQKAALKSKRQQQPEPTPEPQQTKENGQQQTPSAQRKPIQVTNAMGAGVKNTQPPFETATQKRARLENVLRTGDTTLLRAPQR